MFRLLSLPHLLTLLLACTNPSTVGKQTTKLGHPEFSSSKMLPQRIRVVGTVRELSPGLCGIYCQGGYVKVDLDVNIPNFQLTSVYLITACLALGVKPGAKVDLIATLYTGKETECYYQHFDKPEHSDDYVFYKLSEIETSKIHN
jgi:hypothetical protein